MNETTKVDVLSDLRSVMRIAKAAHIGSAGQCLRIRRAENALESLAELIEAAAHAVSPEASGSAEMAARKRLMDAVSRCGGAK